MRRREFIAGAAIAPMLLSGTSTAQQPGRRYRIGFLALDPGEDGSPLLARLNELGYVVGDNLNFLHRSAENDPKRLALLADELVREQPDVLVAGWGTLAPKALKQATGTIPIVFTTVGDPLGAGLVSNFARPGGNITGFSGQAAELKGKQLALLKEVAPGQQVVGVLMNPDTPYTALALRQLRSAADAEGTRLEVLEVRSPDEFSAARMDGLVASGATSMFILEDPLTSNIRDRVIEQARRLRLPTICGLADYVRAGALISYGSRRSDFYRRSAEYVDKILKGTRPGDLPVEQPTTFEFTVNLNTAQALGLNLSTSLLSRADEVIE
jgi:putative ABC transport system substrate-binding protein